MTAPGFYGKLASRGDFVTRDLPQSFVQPWDHWLASGLHASRQQLGDEWLSAYLITPLWRFVLAEGVCGPDAVVGLLMPSIDRVGRYFPLTVAQILEPDQSLAALVGGADAWFEQTEALMLSTLVEGVGYGAFESGLTGLDRLPTAPRAGRTGFAGLLASAANNDHARCRALADFACDEHSLWWSRGSEGIAPGLLRCSGLPDVSVFGSFLLGQGAVT